MKLEMKAMPHLNYTLKIFLKDQDAYGIIGNDGVEKRAKKTIPDTIEEYEAAKL